MVFIAHSSQLPPPSGETVAMVTQHTVLLMACNKLIITYCDILLYLYILLLQLYIYIDIVYSYL